VALSNHGTIGRYQLIKRLAVGGMADIWLAQERGKKGYERTVVVKSLRDDVTDDDDLIPMFVEEARIAACLKHESIVELYEVGKFEGGHFLAMEFVFGRDLRALRERLADRGEKLPHKHAVAIVADVLEALYYAHHDATFEGRPLRVVHRDVSPQNVIVGFDGGVKLLDFGIAKAAAQLSRTRAGVLKGKYAYMSPEQVNLREVDHRADVFSAGVVLWELLTGRRLFLRDTEYETIQAVVACSIPRARAIDPNIPRTLSWICTRALRRAPRWRYRDARAMSQALRAWDGRDPQVARDELAQWMAHLFREELTVRDATLQLQRKEPTRFRQIQDAGFELVDEARLEAVRPRRAGSITLDGVLRVRAGGSLLAQQPPRAPERRGLWAGIGTVVLVGAGVGVWWGVAEDARSREQYAYVTVLAGSSDVEITIGNRRVGRAPVRDVVLIPGRHRIVGVWGDDRETVEIVVAPGRHETVELSLPSARADR
jgi:hypothetical protein